MYDLIILICFHENEECLLDQIANIKKFNKQKVAIIISNAGESSLDVLRDVDSVFVVDRNPKTTEKFITLIPSHVQLWDYVTENNIKSKYVLLLSTNQLFINSGFFDFIQEYNAGYFDRPIRDNISYWMTGLFPIFHQSIGEQYFTKQSNHDGMFFKFDLFDSMMSYFSRYRGIVEQNHKEEFLYYAYINKYSDTFVDFSSYNYFCADISSNCLSFRKTSIEDVDREKKNGKFLVKRVERNINDPVRIYIKENINE